MSTLSLSPDKGESEEEPCKEAAEDVEHHVGGEAGHCQVLHCVEPKKADPNEEKSAIDLIMMSDEDDVYDGHDDKHENEDTGCVFSLGPSDFGTKKKTSIQPITAAVSVNPVSKAFFWY